MIVNILTKEVKNLYKHKAPDWINDTITDNDKNILDKEANDVSPFDKLNLKKNTLNTPNTSFVVKKCKYGRIVIVTETPNDIQSVMKVTTEMRYALLIEFANESFDVNCSTDA